MIEGKYYNEFIETRDVLTKKKSKKFKNRLHFLGYLDGIYAEEEYKRYIPDDEECINLYAKGYNEGKTDRKNNTSKLSFTKSTWISKLAVSDYKNSFRNRNLTPEAEELYNLDYNDLLGFGEDDIDRLNKELEEGSIKF